MLREKTRKRQNIFIPLSLSVKGNYHRTTNECEMKHWYLVSHLPVDPMWKNTYLFSEFIL